jgi:hypothetical protein
MLRAVRLVCKSHLQRTGNFPAGVSGLAVIPLQGNPDGHGKAAINSDENRVDAQVQLKFNP